MQYESISLITFQSRVWSTLETKHFDFGHPVGAKFLENVKSYLPIFLESQNQDVSQPEATWANRYTVTILVVLQISIRLENTSQSLLKIFFQLMGIWKISTLFFKKNLVPVDSLLDFSKLNVWMSHKRYYILCDQFALFGVKIITL